MPAMIRIDTPLPPPPWAVMQRALLRAQVPALEAFYAKYFDERGYLRCVPRWGGDDGADDAAENFTGWTLLYALGAGEAVLERYLSAWEGHLRQYTEARTTEVEFARGGMYFKEFPVMFDWGHNGEGFNAFFLQGLCTPYDAAFQARTRRYAGFYLGEDPIARNYDPRHRVIRSMFNGSRGPLLRKATALDWAGDPIEIAGRFKPGHQEHSYEQMLAHFAEYTDVEGDHPLNLQTTTLALNAYLIAGEAKYRDWIVEYVGAWRERTAANGGIIPSNVGLDGTLGGACGGRWWGGTYGWGFTIDDYLNPGSGGRIHRHSFIERAPLAFGNALLATGDHAYVDTWRGVIEGVNANAKVAGGQTLYPHCYGEEEGSPGWYNYRPEPYANGALPVWFWSMREADKKLIAGHEWIRYLDGANPDYPVAALQQEFAELRRRGQRLQEDISSPDTRMSDDSMDANPALTTALTRLMLGGFEPRHYGFPLHCRLRYFDPERRRPGLPRRGGAGRRHVGVGSDGNAGQPGSGGRPLRSDAGRRLRRTPLRHGARRHRAHRRGAGCRRPPLGHRAPGAGLRRPPDVRAAPLHRAPHLHLPLAPPRITGTGAGRNPPYSRRSRNRRGHRSNTAKRRPPVAERFQVHVRLGVEDQQRLKVDMI